MSLYLTNNPLQQGASYTTNPASTRLQFIEKTYTSGTTQEWIYLPESGYASVTLSVSASTASIECTDSPPDIVEGGGTPVAVTWPAGIVGATTTVLLQGFTALRVNIATGASVKISAKAV
jgi:hypothetical protein